jgi:predicted dehydrogenase
MELYGTTGVVYADNRNDLRMRKAVGYDGYKETKRTLAERPAPYNDPFSFFAAVIRNEIALPSYDLSSLENNMVVMEILDAAKKSASKGQTVLIK